MHDKIKNLSEARIKFLIEKEIPFYKGHNTYIGWIKDELEEAIEEMKDNNSVHLEDELWDVFWTYICLLQSLEQEWKITSVENVFNRCYKKFWERIWFDWKWWKSWQEVKDKQKQELKIEHNNLYNK